MNEPLIHSHITDGLPNSHPLAYESVNCAACCESLHAANNECMQTWVESGRGNFCLACFAVDGEVLDDTSGLMA